jgi:hypothetical protein
MAGGLTGQTEGDHSRKLRQSLRVRRTVQTNKAPDEPDTEQMSIDEIRSFDSAAGSMAGSAA